MNLFCIILKNESGTRTLIAVDETKLRDFSKLKIKSIEETKKAALKKDAFFS
jgi:hypothetical protein